MGRLKIIGSLFLSLGFSGFCVAQIPKNLQEANKLFFVKGGKTTIGDSSEIDAPPFQTKVKNFRMQAYEVTNAQFAAFVQKTHYKTLAERNGGSYVFEPHAKVDSLSIPGTPWWHFEKGADWQHPEGKNSSIDGKDFYPVTHISYEDAKCYCAAQGMDLPTEVEWEYAAQKNGILPKKNVFQGHFPDKNSVKDGFEETSPVGYFGSGKIGLFDLQGNVWEWCLDPYHPNAYRYAKIGTTPSCEPLVPKSFDATSPNEDMRVIRGGSFLCNDSYCSGYIPTRRMRASTKMTFQHIGFRCVKR